MSTAAKTLISGFGQGKGSSSQVAENWDMTTNLPMRCVLGLQAQV